MAVRDLTCIECPLGCKVKIFAEGKEIINVEGFGCARGRDYAVKELLDPRRTVITVVKCKNGRLPTVSVKTDKPVPKGKLWEIIRTLSRIEVEAPVAIGQIIVKNVLDLRVDVVATRPDP